MVVNRQKDIKNKHLFIENPHHPSSLGDPLTKFDAIGTMLPKLVAKNRVER